MKVRIKFAKRTAIYSSVIACLAFIGLAVVRLRLTVDQAMQFLWVSVLLIAAIIGLAALVAWVIRRIAGRGD